MNTLNAVIAHSKCCLPQYLIDYILKYLFKVKAIASSAYHTIIVTKDGTVFTCGNNYHGQLGLGDTKDRKTFTPVPALPEGVFASQVVCCYYHTMIIAHDGTVFACGRNVFGQLGLGDEDDRNTFTAVPALPEGKVASQVVPGGTHTMIIAQDGTVFACGMNNEGQLGLGDNTHRNTFTAVPALPDGTVASQVVTARNMYSGHTMILAEDGTVFACGRNNCWHLGLGDKDERNTFTAVPALPEGVVAKQVNAGVRHTTILTEDGTVFACGDNYHGQLGLGDGIGRRTFTAVPALPEAVVIKQVVAGESHTMIIAQDGTLFACGKNHDGQLGLGDTENRSTFTVV